MTTEHDELLARLDADAKELYKTDAIDIVQDCVGNNLYDDMLSAIAAIRDLSAKLEAESNNLETLKGIALFSKSEAERYRNLYEAERKAREKLEEELKGWREGTYHGF